MEKLVVIMDEMSEYAARLAVYLNGRRGFPYRAVVFSAPEEIKSYVESGAVHAILAAECYEKEVLGTVVNSSVRVFWFCDTKEARGESFVYRYRSAKEIEKRLMEMEKVAKKLRVFGVYSPAGGVCFERLSEEIGNGFAREGKVLYLPFVPFGIYGREFGDGLSELLFYVKQREEMSVDSFEQLLQTGGGAHRIGPVRWSTELREISKEDIESLLRFLETKTEYDTVVMAVGQFDVAGVTVLQSCDTILTPVWETEEGRRLQTEFLRQLKESGEAELLSRMVEFPLPSDGEGVGFLQAVAEAVKRGGEVSLGDKGGDSVSDTGTVNPFGRTNR
ncbi:MAG: hypothetical protein IJW37_08435 [Lachnospiraceae bacterium]|nr:hypothetical protein [Lachnospiraceae bacterium]